MYAVIILMFVIVVILWKVYSMFSKLVEEIKARDSAVNTEWGSNVSVKDHLYFTYRRICEIEKSTSQILSIATKEHPAGVNFHEYVRSDNLANIYAEYLESYENLPKHLAIKRARFEVTNFGQEAIAKKINSDFRNGVKDQRERNDSAEFFSSGIIEKDIEIRLNNNIIPYDLFGPLYDLIVKQRYSGEKDFASELTTYTVKTYEEMVNRAAIISKLEQLGVLMRTGGENWGAFLRFRLKSTDTSELKKLIYSGGPSHDDGYFDEQFNEGKLPRIFDAFDLRLI